MSRLAIALVLALTALLASATAQAATFTGTFLMQASGFPALSLPGSGSGDPSLPSITVDSFLGTTSAPVPSSPPITQVVLDVSSNASGTVGTGPAISGAMRFKGFGGATLFLVPLGGSRVGYPGASFEPHSGGSSTMSVVYDRWGTGAATVSRTHTVASAACVAGSSTCPTGMLSGATASALYFGGAAQIVLVSPVDLYTTTTGGIATFAVMALNYVPEPGTLLLLGSGAAGLGLMGRRRQGR